MLGFAPEDYELVKMDKIMAKCINEKITINPSIAMYSKETIDYIVLHEFCHMKYKIHTKNFWKIIAKYMPSYERYENILKGLSY